MAIRVSNFRPAGLPASFTEDEFYINDDGKLASGPIAGAQTLDCKGAWISPGWADLHVHIWHGGTDISVPASEAGLERGVTAMADAGSAGEASFHGLRQYVIDRRPETIRAFLNIGSIGLVACNRVSELIDTRFIDVDRTLAVIEANRDVICGVKVRASGVIVGSWGITPVRIAKRVAEISGLPLMVHIGEPPPMIDEIFELLTPGDVVTHCFNGKKSGSIADTPELMALANRLAEDGVLMDVGHGAASFDFEVARHAIGEGLVPFSISTDLHGHNIAGPVFDLATTVSKLHAVGLDFEQCVAAISTRPRGFIGLDGPPSFVSGTRADFTLFDLVDCDEQVEDSVGNRVQLRKLFEPRYAVLGTEIVPASRATPMGAGD